MAFPRGLELVECSEHRICRDQFSDSIEFEIVLAKFAENFHRNLGNGPERARGALPLRGGDRRVKRTQFIRELADRGADVNARLTRGRRAGKGRVSVVGATPFFLAADRADLAFMKLLVELGADPLIPNE